VTSLAGTTPPTTAPGMRSPSWALTRSSLRAPEGNSGGFVIGDTSAAGSGPVVFWGAQVTKKGSTISGTVVHVVVVETNGGYGPNPGQAGTGSLVATIC
jgi:hypothetical protein